MENQNQRISENESVVVYIKQRDEFLLYGIEQSLPSGSMIVAILDHDDIMYLNTFAFNEDEIPSTLLIAAWNVARWNAHAPQIPVMWGKICRCAECRETRRLACGDYENDAGGREGECRYFY